MSTFATARDACVPPNLQTLFVVVMGLAFELNVFFLKYALWIPPTNPLNTYRFVFF
jgi:phosphatidylserine synthase 2